MVKTISRKISVKDSAAKSFEKLPTGDKTIGLHTEIHFCELVDFDKTEEVEESEILVNYDSSLAVSKQKLVKMNFLYINMFGYE